MWGIEQSRRKASVQLQMSKAANLLVARVRNRACSFRDGTETRKALLELADELEWWADYVKAEAGSSGRNTLPPASRSASSQKRIVKHLVSKPGKKACIEDYRRLQAQWGDQLTRRLFLRRSKTGRRYEKLWKNWMDFTGDAGGGRK